MNLLAEIRGLSFADAKELVKETAYNLDVTIPTLKSWEQMKDVINTIVQPVITEAREEKRQAKLFTFSYFSGEGAEFNKASDYFEDIVIVKAKHKINTNEYTAKYHEFKKQGYVFCKWLDVGTSIMLMVKPSNLVFGITNKRYGYKCESMQVNRGERVVWSGRESSIGHTMDAVAGDLKKDDFNAFVIRCLYRNKNEYLYLWIGEITDQQSVKRECLNGDYREWYLFDSHKCFVRNNWPCEENKTKCFQCGKEH